MNKLKEQLALVQEEFVSGRRKIELRERLFTDKERQVKEREERLKANEENLIREREAIMAQLELSSVARSESVTSL